MQISIKYGEMVHVHYVPLLTLPVQWHPPPPHPFNYPQIQAAAKIWKSMNALVKQVSDENVRLAMKQGMRDGLRAMQKHAGQDVEILLDEEDA